MKNLSKTWLWVIVSLLVLNLALTLFLFSQKNKRQEPGRFLSESLGLNEGQQSKFEDAKKDHFKTMKQLDDQLQEAKRSLFAEIGESSEIRKEQILNRIAELTKSKDRETLNHFSEVRTFLTQEQKIAFDQLLIEMTKGRSPAGPPPGGMGRPPHEGRGNGGNTRPPEGMQGDIPPDGPPPRENGERPPPPRD